MGETLIWHELWYKNTDHNDSEDFYVYFSRGVLDYILDMFCSEDISSHVL